MERDLQRTHVIRVSALDQSEDSHSVIISISAFSGILGKHLEVENEVDMHSKHTFRVFLFMGNWERMGWGRAGSLSDDWHHI